VVERSVLCKRAAYSQGKAWNNVAALIFREGENKIKISSFVVSNTRGPTLRKQVVPCESLPLTNNWIALCWWNVWFGAILRLVGLPVSTVQHSVSWLNSLMQEAVADHGLGCLYHTIVHVTLIFFLPLAHYGSNSMLQHLYYNLSAFILSVSTTIPDLTILEFIF
jgi:hypothetical protein